MKGLRAQRWRKAILSISPFLHSGVFCKSSYFPPVLRSSLLHFISLPALFSVCVNTLHSVFDFCLLCFHSSQYLASPSRLPSLFFFFPHLLPRRSSFFFRPKRPPSKMPAVQTTNPPKRTTFNRKLERQSNRHNCPDKRTEASIRFVLCRAAKRL